MGQKINFNFGWKFHNGDLPSSNENNFTDNSQWETVDIPHDFIMMCQSFQFSTKTIVWYKKTLFLDKGCENKYIYLEFEGISHSCEVYINDFYVDGRKNGNTGFYFDISSYLKYDCDNVIAVKINTATSLNPNYYEGGGIYRNVWIHICNQPHVYNWGIFVTSKVDLSSNTAEVKIQTDIAGKSFTLISEIISPKQETVAVCRNEIQDSSSSPIIKQECTIPFAELWSIETPVLYTLVTKIYQQNVLVDSRETLFGIRDIRFDKEKGFFLNGKHIKLNGICCHQDFAGIGLAVPDSLFAYRIKILKSIGANAYLLTHFPPSASFLTACDKAGMLVIAKNNVLTNSEDDIRELRAMIRQGRNHPSLIMYALGSENDHTPLFTNANRIVKYLIRQIHLLDTTRPVTAILTNSQQKIIPDIADQLDVLSFNNSGDYQKQYLQFKNHKPIIITKSATEKCEKDTEQIANELQTVQMTPYICGSFTQTGFDHYINVLPYQQFSQSGIFDLLGKPKDLALYYQCWWTDKPIIHTSQNWIRSFREEKLDISIYTNYGEAELFLNDKSVGRKTNKKYHQLVYKNIIHQGDVLSAKGYQTKRNDVITTKCIRPNGAPYQLSIDAASYTLKSDGQDCTVVTVSVIDEIGNVIPYANNRVTFSIEGNGKIIGIANTDSRRHLLYHDLDINCFNGYCQCIVRSGKEGPSEIKITVTSPMLKSDQLTIETI